MKSDAQNAFEKNRQVLYSAPGMIEEAERKLLFKSAFMSLDLPIVEFGSFFGASTLALAKGVKSKRNCPEIIKIYSFDAFKVSRHHAFYEQVINFAKFFNLDDLLQYSGSEVDWIKVTKTILKDDLDVTEINQILINDDFNPSILPQRIGFIHLDLPKDSETIRPILKSAFPLLVKGSTVVFQDFYYYFSDELIAFFELLEDKGIITSINVAGSSNFYRLNIDYANKVPWLDLLTESLDNKNMLIRNAINRHSINKMSSSKQIIRLITALINSIAKYPLPIRGKSKHMISNLIRRSNEINTAETAEILAALLVERLEQHK